MQIWLLFVLIKLVNTEVLRKEMCTGGHPGIPGNPGHNGIPGRDGRDGSVGKKGDTRPSGVPGAKGRRGEQGSKGTSGKIGPKGIPGPVGHKGQKGELGLQGQQGVKGDLGPRGPKGDKGAIGLQGNIGLPGPVGPTGVRGPNGEVGSEGPRGCPGIQGERGDKGEIGEKGNNGENALIRNSAFSVGLTEVSKWPRSGSPIKFEKVIYNNQNHYDLSTGKFTCVFSGVYYFVYHITVYVKHVRVALYKNGAPVLNTFDSYQNSEDQAAGGTLLQLQTGDQVWLQVIGGDSYNGLFADNNDDTVFTGFLLFTE
ncbi:complement C1q and tumor necrosis factor-related protein 9A [Rhincodon typus]|uniref:complement C1q and tumor necrosis factor-related protein 9A n=1 Tax=Rhincodon typus TaxID=259920 RepID=UPI00202E1DBB|nr:complement C1q and tumor necrosis factor-related protein 9A [Rhincodon typus]